MLFIIAVFYGILFFAWWTEQPGNQEVKQAVEGSMIFEDLISASSGLARSLANGEWWKAAGYAVMLPVSLLFALSFWVGRRSRS